MVFKSGRPFWDNSNITSYGHCKFDFASPAQTTFLWTFMGPYIIIMFFMKYTAKPRPVITVISWILWFAIMLDVYFTGYLLGEDYLF